MGPEIVVALGGMTMVLATVTGIPEGQRFTTKLLAESTNKLVPPVSVRIPKSSNT